MTPNSLRTVVAQMYRGGSRQAARTFYSLPPHIGKGDVCSRTNLFWEKRFFSAEAEPEPEPFYQLQSDGSVESITKWEKLHQLDFTSSLLEEIPENELIGRAIERMSASGEVEIALAVYSLAKEKVLIIPSRFIFCLVKALARKKKSEESKALLQEMISRGSFPRNEVFNVVVYACSRNGDPDGAREVLKQMESSGLVPDVYTYTMVISGYANGGAMSRAMEILAEAKQKHSKLSPVTYQALLQGFFKAEQYEDVLKLFEDQDLFGVKPRGDEYTKLIHAFCLVAMDWRRAEFVHIEMKHKNMLLDPISKGYIASLRAMDPYAPKGQYDTSLSYFGHQFTTVRADFLAAFSEMSHGFVLFLFKIFPRLGVWLGRALFAFDDTRTRFWDRFMGRSRSHHRREYDDQEEVARRVGGLLGLLIIGVILYCYHKLNETARKLREESTSKTKEANAKDRKIKMDRKSAKIIMEWLSITYPNAVLEAQRVRFAHFKL